MSGALHELLRSYGATLPYDRRMLLEQFQLTDLARKVVGVGSVGTRAWIALLLGRDGRDPLFLQLKEAQPSVLEAFLKRSEFHNHGERVVAGQHLTQANSDILLGWIFAPIAWAMGVAWKDAATIGNLLGTRMVLNEFVAFAKLGEIVKNTPGALSPRSIVITTYALCGFANFSSIAIQIGGIGALAPTRKSDLARLGLRAVAAGTMANFMSACIAGMLL